MQIKYNGFYFLKVDLLVVYLLQYYLPILIAFDLKIAVKYS